MTKKKETKKQEAPSQAILEANISNEFINEVSAVAKKYVEAGKISNVGIIGCLYYFCSSLGFSMFQMQQMAQMQKETGKK